MAVRQPAFLLYNRRHRQMMFRQRTCLSVLSRYLTSRCRRPWSCHLLSHRQSRQPLSNLPRCLPCRWAPTSQRPGRNCPGGRLMMSQRFGQRFCSPAEVCVATRHGLWSARPPRLCQPRQARRPSEPFLMSTSSHGRPYSRMVPRKA